MPRWRGASGVGAGHKVNMGGVMGRRGVHLLAVNDVLIAVAHGATLQTSQVGAGLRLGEAQRENDLPVNQPRDEMLLLLFGPCGQDGRSAATGTADRDANAGEFLLHDVLFHAASALPTVFPGPADSNPFAFGNLANQFAVVLSATTFLCGFQFAQDIVGHVLRDECLDILAEGFLFRGVCKVHFGLVLSGLGGLRSASSDAHAKL